MPTPAWARPSGPSACSNKRFRLGRRSRTRKSSGSYPGAWNDGVAVQGRNDPACRSWKDVLERLRFEQTLSMRSRSARTGARRARRTGQECLLRRVPGTPYSTPGAKNPNGSCRRLVVSRTAGPVARATHQRRPESRPAVRFPGTCPLDPASRARPGPTPSPRASPRPWRAGPSPRYLPGKGPVP